MLSDQIFAKNAKTILEHFQNGPNRGKMKIAKISKSPGISRKVTFMAFETQDTDLKFCTLIHLPVFFHMLFGFWNVEKCLCFFAKGNTLMIILLFSKNPYPILQVDSTHQSATLENINWYYLENFTLDEFLYFILFSCDRNRQNMTSLDVICGTSSSQAELRKMPSARMCKIDQRSRVQSLVVISVFALELLKDKWSRSFRSPGNRFRQQDAG